MSGHVTRCPVSDDEHWCYARPGRVYRRKVEVIVRAARKMIALAPDDARRLVAEIQAALVEVEAR